MKFQTPLITVNKGTKSSILANAANLEMDMAGQLVGKSEVWCLAILNVAPLNYYPSLRSASTISRSVSRPIISLVVLLLMCLILSSV